VVEPVVDFGASLALTKKLNRAEVEFEKEFEEYVIHYCDSIIVLFSFACICVFPLSAPLLTCSKFSFSRSFGSEHQRFGRIALSNLMGGIGYFYGRNRIRIPVLL
jgi:hypothetical protein